MTALRRLAEDVCALALDEETVEAVERRIFDSLAAVEVGRHIADVPRLAGSTDPATLIRFATAAGRATEADDIHVPSCTTIGAVVVPAAVLAARDGGDLHAAVAAGYEAIVRLGLAVGGASLVYAGTWTTLVCAPVGVAAAIARALRLDAAMTASALALAASRAVAAAPAPGDGLLPRWWAIGAAAADGWLAVDAARAGVGAEPAGLALPVAVDAERLAAPLGRPAVHDVDTKAFPAARQTLPAVEAALEAAAGLASEAIETISIGVPAQVLAMVDRTGSTRDRLDSLVDVRYQVALALTQPEALFDAVRANPPAAPPLAARIHVAADAELTAAFPVLGGRAEVRVRGEQGVRHALVRAPAGSAERPFGWNELESKWQRIAAASGCPASRLTEIRAAAGNPGLLARLLVDAR